MEAEPQCGGEPTKVSSPFYKITYFRVCFTRILCLVQLFPKSDAESGCKILYAGIWVLVGILTFIESEVNIYYKDQNSCDLQNKINTLIN